MRVLEHHSPRGVPGSREGEGDRRLQGPRRLPLLTAKARGESGCPYRKDLSQPMENKVVLLRGVYYIGVYTMLGYA